MTTEYKWVKDADTSYYETGFDRWCLYKNYKPGGHNLYLAVIDHNNMRKLSRGVTCKSEWDYFLPGRGVREYTPIPEEAVTLQEKLAYVATLVRMS